MIETDLKRCKVCGLEIPEGAGMIIFRSSENEWYYDKACWAKEKKQRDKVAMFKGYKKGPWMVEEIDFSAYDKNPWRPFHVRKKRYFNTKKEGREYLKSCFNPDNNDLWMGSDGICSWDSDSGSIYFLLDKTNNK